MCEVLLIMVVRVTYTIKRNSDTDLLKLIPFSSYKDVYYDTYLLSVICAENKTVTYDCEMSTHNGGCKYRNKFSPEVPVREPNKNCSQGSSSSLFFG